jgi:TolA-binding protein
MQLEDAPANYLYKLWPWFEANWVRIAWGGGIVVVATGLIYFNYERRAQREIEAGQAMSRAVLTVPDTATAGQQADLFLKLAADYPNTSAGQRAMTQGAMVLFTAGKYPEAQAQFQKFLDTYPGGYFAAQAALGVATCMDVQGKPDLAAATYQKIINTYADPVVVDHARFALAQIDERQGKLADAANLYETVLRYNPNSMMGTEAGLRLMELKTRLPATPPSNATAVPPKPNL